MRSMTPRRKPLKKMAKSKNKLPKMPALPKTRRLQNKQSPQIKPRLRIKPNRRRTLSTTIFLSYTVISNKCGNMERIQCCYVAMCMLIAECFRGGIND